MHKNSRGAGGLANSIIVEAIAFTIFFILAIVIIIAFASLLCSNVPYACGFVKQVITLVILIMLLLLVGAIIYFVIDYMILESNSNVYLY